MLAPVLALTVAAPAQGQVGGRVVDGSGQPVTGARVEMWGPLRRLSTRETDASGAFTFTGPQADSATGLVVSRIGHASRSLSIRPPASSLLIRLSEAVLQLEPLAVRASSRRLCPNRDEPAARTLWSAAAARYGSPDTLSIQADEVFVTGEVPWAELGMVDETALRRNQRMTGPQRRDIVPGRGYGFRITSSWDADFVAWYYMQLGSHFTQHFIDASFGTYNSLSIRARAADATVLAFCSRNLGRGAVGIEGTLTIAHDTTFVSATWQYLPPDPVEVAGGEVTFAPHPGSPRLPWLVPAASLYWRAIHGRRDLYFQRWERFNEWVIDTGLPPGPRQSP